MTTAEAVEHEFKVDPGVLRAAVAGTIRKFCVYRRGPIRVGEAVRFVDGRSWAVFTVSHAVPESSGDWIDLTLSGPIASLILPGEDS